MGVCIDLRALAALRRVVGCGTTPRRRTLITLRNMHVPIASRTAPVAERASVSAADDGPRIAGSVPPGLVRDAWPMKSHDTNRKSGATRFQGF